MPANSAVLESKSEILIRLESDLDTEGFFGRRVFEVTSDEIRVKDEENGNSNVTTRIPLTDLKTARHEPLLSGGRFEVTLKSGAVIPVVTYSMNVAAKFSEAARGVEQLIEGQPLSINLATEKTRCEKCNRLLPEKDGICPACMNRNQTLLRVARYLKPYKVQAASLAVLAIVSTAINLVPPTIQGAIIDRVIEPRKNLPVLGQLIGLWFFTLFVTVGLQVVSARLTTWLAGHIATDLRAGVYRSIEFLQLSFFDKKQTGQITSRITQDTDRVWGFLSEGLPFLLSNLMLIIGVLFLLFQISWKLALSVMLPIPLTIFIGAYFWSYQTTLFHRWSSRWGRFHTHLNESLSGIRVVKAFAQEDTENDKFERHNVSLKEAGIRADSYWHSVFGAMSFCTSLGAVILWAVGGYLVYSGEMTLGDFWRAQAYIGLVYGPMQWFAQVNNWFSRAMAGAEKIFEVMDSKPENYNSEGKTP